MDRTSQLPPSTRASQPDIPVEERAQEALRAAEGERLRAAGAEQRASTLMYQLEHARMERPVESAISVSAEAVTVSRRGKR